MAKVILTTKDLVVMQDLVIKDMDMEEVMWTIRGSVAMLVMDTRDMVIMEAMDMEEVIVQGVAMLTILIITNQMPRGKMNVIQQLYYLYFCDHKN